MVDELLEKGHISRPYLGLAMQPVAVPESLRNKLKSGLTSGLVIVHVEPLIAEISRAFEEITRKSADLHGN